MDPSFDTVLTKGLDHLNYHLSPLQMEQIRVYASQLMLWNKKINLTAIRKTEEIAEKHFIDSIAASTFLPAADRVVDIGSGGGFPGIVFKILDPDLDMVLVDASQKKVNFLKHVIRTVGLEGIEAIHARVEALQRLSPYAGSFDLAVSRAFSALDKFVGLAQPLIKPDGWISAMKGKNFSEEIFSSIKAAYDIQTDHYQLPFEKSDRYMLLLKQKI